MNNTSPSLREIWEAKELTATELAAQCNVSVGTIYAANRKARIKGQTVAAICRVLGISKAEYDQLRAE